MSEQTLNGIPGLFTGPVWAALAQNYGPAQWNRNGCRIRNGAGELDGSLTFTNGKTGTARLTLRRLGNNRRITSFQLNPT